MEKMKIAIFLYNENIFIPKIQLKERSLVISHIIYDILDKRVRNRKKGWKNHLNKVIIYDDVHYAVLIGLFKRWIVHI